MIKYKARWWAISPTIKKVEVEKETAMFVTLMNGHRETKESQYDSYHNSYEEAYDWLEKKARKQLEDAHVALSRAQKTVNLIDRLKEDK